jgi:hypothetical protein
MTDIAHAQIKISKKFKQQAWQDTIKAKITNQAKVLKF